MVRHPVGGLYPARPDEVRRRPHGIRPGPPFHRPDLIDEGFLKEAARWIGCDTVTTRSNGRLLSRAETLLRALGWSTRRQRVTERGVPFYNLLARRGPAAGKPLLLNTHTDTVPPGPADRWTRTGGDPFRLTRRGGFLYGLGVADVKLNLLCQIEAARRSKDLVFRKPVVIAATYGEERGLEGARRVIAAWRGPKPALVLAGEPTEMAVIHRHRGYLVFEWCLPAGPRGRGESREFTMGGKSAHSSTPHLGVNALDKALDHWARLSRGGKDAAVSAAAGGTAHNQVPAEARYTVLTGTGGRPAGLLPWRELFRLRALRAGLPSTHTLNWAMLGWEGGRGAARFDLRFPPGDDPARLIRTVRRALAGAGTVRVLLSDPPLDGAPHGFAAAFVTKVLRRAGLSTTLKEKLTCTEAGLYDAWGAPAVVIGPGRSTGNIHRPNERIATAQLGAAVSFYERLLEAWQHG